jgi:hypothetical protein
MTSLRSPEFQQFLTSAETAIRHGCGVDGPVHAAADRMFSAFKVLAGQVERKRTSRLPVCRHLATALDHARRQPGPVSALADAFAVLEPWLNWKVRAGAEAHGEQFLDGHANATLAGPEGLEIWRDIRIGVSLMAPNVRNPDHHHPPEEIYVVLSDGQWRQADRPWHEPSSRFGFFGQEDENTVWEVGGRGSSGPRKGCCWKLKG